VNVKINGIDKRATNEYTGYNVGGKGVQDMKGIVKITLVLCVCFMALCIVLSVWNPDNQFIRDGFEAFGTIFLITLVWNMLFNP